MITYTVKQGDTLSSIAKRFNTTVKDIQRLNSKLIRDVNKISVGWTLHISSPFLVESNRCSKCEALNKALADINNLPSVKELFDLIGE